MASFIYEVLLNGKCVGNSGDYTFRTEEEAKEDAKEFIQYELTKEHGANEDEFEINAYRAFL